MGGYEDSHSRTEKGVVVAPIAWDVTDFSDDTAQSILGIFGTAWTLGTYQVSAILMRAFFDGLTCASERPREFLSIATRSALEFFDDATRSALEFFKIPGPWLGWHAQTAWNLLENSISGILASSLLDVMGVMRGASEIFQILSRSARQFFGNATRSALEFSNIATSITPGGPVVDVTFLNSWTSLKEMKCVGGDASKIFQILLHSASPSFDDATRSALEFSNFTIVATVTGLVVSNYTESSTRDLFLVLELAKVSLIVVATAVMVIAQKDLTILKVAMCGVYTNGVLTFGLGQLLPHCEKSRVGSADFRCVSKQKDTKLARTLGVFTACVFESIYFGFRNELRRFFRNLPAQIESHKRRGDRFLKSRSLRLSGGGDAPSPSEWVDVVDDSTVVRKFAEGRGSGSGSRYTRPDRASGVTAR